MLLNSFYKILHSEKQVSGLVKSHIRINTTDPIFEGHFPSVPVVPGVCMLQMIKEHLEIELRTNLQLSKAAGLKFLAVINPLENPELIIQIAYSINPDMSITADGSISASDKIFFKIAKAAYKSTDGKA